MTKREFLKMVEQEDSFSYAMEKLMSMHKNEITTFEKLQEYCIKQLEMEGDIKQVSDITSTLDSMWGYWIYDYSNPYPPIPIQCTNDIVGFLDEDEEDQDL